MVLLFIFLNILLEINNQHEKKKKKESKKTPEKNELIHQSKINIESN